MTQEELKTYLEERIDSKIRVLENKIIIPEQSEKIIRKPISLNEFTGFNVIKVDDIDVAPTQNPNKRGMVLFQTDDTGVTMWVSLNGSWEKITQDTSIYELLSNKDTDTDLGTSDTKYPTQKAVKTYVDTSIENVAISFTASDSLLKATTTTPISKASATPVKFIEVVSPVDGGLRVKWQAGISYDEIGYMRIYINDEAAGTQKQLAIGGSATNITDNIDGVKKGDKIQIYGWSAGGVRDIIMSPYSSSFAEGTIMAVYGSMYNWTYKTF